MTVEQSRRARGSIVLQLVTWCPGLTEHSRGRDGTNPGQQKLRVPNPIQHMYTTDLPYRKEGSSSLQVGKTDHGWDMKSNDKEASSYKLNWTSYIVQNPHNKQGQIRKERPITLEIDPGRKGSRCCNVSNTKSSRDTSKLTRESSSIRDEPTKKTKPTF